MYVIDELSRACYPRSSGRLFFSIFYKTQDDAFRVAAQTWRLSVISQEEFSPAVDGFLEKEVRTEGEFVNAWNSIRTMAQRRRLAVWAGHLLTHASKPDDSSGGLEFRPHGDGRTLERHEITALVKLPWDNRGFLVLAGCNTGNIGRRGWCPAQSFAEAQGVPTLGQTGYGYFSRKWLSYQDSDTGICLWAFHRGKNGALGSKAGMAARIFRNG